VYICFESDDLNHKVFLAQIINFSLQNRKENELSHRASGNMRHIKKVALQLPMSWCTSLSLYDQITRPSCILIWRRGTWSVNRGAWRHRRVTWRRDEDFENRVASINANTSHQPTASWSSPEVASLPQVLIFLARSSQPASIPLVCGWSDCENCANLNL
jgi:hypothetical protein